MNDNAVKKQNIIDVDKESVSSKELKTKKRTISESDRMAANAVSALWKNYKEKHKNVCQKTFADEYFGWSQGLFSQYLTGRVPISLKKALKFAEVFECDPGDIRPEFRNNKIHDLNAKMASQLTQALQILQNEHGVDVENNDFCQEVMATLSLPSVFLNLVGKKDSEPNR